METKTKMTVQSETKLTAKEAVALVERCNTENPSPQDLALLERELDSKPALVQALGDYGQHVFEAILSHAVGNSAARRESLGRFIENMKHELDYQNSSFVEKMLIREICVRWLRLQTMEQMHFEVMSKNHTLEQGIYVDKQLERAQKRYLRALETFTKVRKMLVQTEAKGAQMFKNLMLNDD
jgi:hypothetical protein